MTDFASKLESLAYRMDILMNDALVRPLTIHWSDVEMLKQAANNIRELEETAAHLGVALHVAIKAR